MGQGKYPIVPEHLVLIQKQYAVAGGDAKRICFPEPCEARMEPCHLELRLDTVSAFGAGGRKCAVDAAREWTYEQFGNGGRASIPWMERRHRKV